MEGIDKWKRLHNLKLKQTAFDGAEKEREKYGYDRTIEVVERTSTSYSWSR